MGKRTGNRRQSSDEALELRNRLEETEETLRAIRQYMVDAFVITRENGTQIVTLNDADFPYRMMVESMNEGAVTLIPDGTIFYVNPCFSKMVQVEESRLIGIRFQDLLMPEQRRQFEEMFKQASRNGNRAEFVLQAATHTPLPVQLSIYRLGEGATTGISVLATDITERVQNEEKIRLLASELTIAEQEERHRISQILHDDLQQRLFAIKSQLSFLKIADDEGSSDLNSTLDQVEAWLNETITITRNLSVDMSPSVLRGEGLAEAILWLSTRMKDQYGLQLKITAKDNLSRINSHMRVLIFQAVRELLFNVVKHSGSSDASITMERLDGYGRITVSDAGKGFDPQMLTMNPANAHGLLLIRDRLNLMHGSMEVHSKPGGGTEITIQFPLEEDLA